MSYYLHPNYASTAPSRSYSEDRSHQSGYSRGSGRSGGKGGMSGIKRTNSTGDEIPRGLASHVDEITSNEESSDDDADQLSSMEDSSHQFGLIAAGGENESVGEYSGGSRQRLNARRDMSRAADEQLHLYPPDTRPAASTARNVASVTPAFQKSTASSRKKSARDLMRHQAGKARGGGGGGVSGSKSFDGGGAYTNSGSGGRNMDWNKTNKTEVEKLKFRIKSRRSVSGASGAGAGRNAITASSSTKYRPMPTTPTKKEDATTSNDDIDALAAVTPSPPMRRVRSNPLEGYDGYDDPDVQPLPSPESSVSSKLGGLRSSKSVDYESGNDQCEDVVQQSRSASRRDGNKSPHTHMAAATSTTASASSAQQQQLPVSSSRQARLERHVQHQMELGQERQVKRGQQQQQRSVHFSQDQAGARASGGNRGTTSQAQPQYRSPQKTRAIGGARSFESPPSSPRSPGSDASRREFAMLATTSPATGLKVSRDGPHATIVKLRRQLDDTLAQNERSKTALARSDAVILELRRDLRETSAKLSKSEGERELIDRRATELESDLSIVKRELHESRTMASARSAELAMITDEVGRANQRDAVLGELQLKLDRAEAQILTADMRNQQLEDDYRRDKEEWEMDLARKEDELDKLRAELGSEVSARKDAEQFWKQNANAREEKMRELEAEISRLSGELSASKDREEAVKSEREMDREALNEVAELRGDLDEAAKVLDDTRNALNEALDELANVRKQKDRAECDRDFIREEMEVLTTKLEQETGEKNQLVKERNALREENSDLRKRDEAAVSRGVMATNERLAENEVRINELSKQLTAAKNEAKQLQARIDGGGAVDKSNLVRTQMEKADLGKAKRELEAKNARIESKLSKLETERDELRQCLDDAMNELEIADKEAKDVYEYKVRNDELEKRVEELDTLIQQRDSDISLLRRQISRLEGEIQGADVAAAAGSRDLPDSSTPPASSRARIEHRRKASENKLRALMGQVAQSIDKRKDPDGFASTRAIPLDSDGELSDDDAALLHHQHAEDLKFKLQRTEDALEITKKELDDLRRQTSSAAVGNITRSKSVDAALDGGYYIASELQEEKARVKSLEMQLASTKADNASSADLRKSLKEAVSLLKPLKEHVAQAEMQKEELRRDLAKSQEQISALEKQSSTGGIGAGDASIVLKLHQKEQEVERLKKETEDMKKALLEAHTASPPTATRAISDESSTSSVRPAQASNQSTNEESDTKLRVELQRTQDDLDTRRRTEKQLKQMLEISQQQLETLTHEHEEMAKRKEELERELDDKAGVTSRQIDAAGSVDDGTVVQRLRRTVQDNERKLKAKDNDLIKLREQLRQTQVCLDDLTGAEASDADIDRLSDDEVRKRLKATNFRMLQIEEELAATKEEMKAKEDVERRLNETLQTEADLEAELSVAIGDLKAKEEAENTLNTSLKEAVGILKPLQGHVETVEKEKTVLMKKLSAAENRIKELEATSSRDLPTSAHKGTGTERRTIKRLEEEKALLEQRIIQLERESIDADQRSRASLGSDMTKDVQKLKERLAEMKSKYDVTKNMLDQSAKTNASLLQDLREMEEEDEEAQEQITLLEQQLEEKEKELTAAKYIATTAIAKVDSLSVNSVDADGASRVSGMSGSGRFLPAVTEGDDAQATITKLKEELRRAKQKNDRLVSSIRQRDQQIIGASGGRRSSVTSEGRRTPVMSEANTEMSVYHHLDLQSGGESSGRSRR